jgi:hypothetical protein
MVLLTLLPAIGFAGCLESDRSKSETDLKCFAIATATERDLASRIQVRNELETDGNIPPELEAENQAHRSREVQQLSAARSVKERFSAAWSHAEPGKSEAFQEEADRQFEEYRVQFLNRECGGELPVK